MENVFNLVKGFLKGLGGLLMAVLGYSKINKIKSNMPSVTGASNEVILGDIYES